MITRQELDTTYQLDGQRHQAHTLIEQTEEHGAACYQAKIKDSPLHGTFGAWASSIPEALDFLNLAMQAKGADEINFDMENRAA